MTSFQAGELHHHDVSIQSMNHFTAFLWAVDCHLTLQLPSPCSFQRRFSVSVFKKPCRAMTSRAVAWQWSLCFYIHREVLRWFQVLSPVEQPPAMVQSCCSHYPLNSRRGGVPCRLVRACWSHRMWSTSWCPHPSALASIAFLSWQDTAFLWTWWSRGTAEASGSQSRHCQKSLRSGARLSLHACTKCSPSRAQCCRIGRKIRTESGGKSWLAKSVLEQNRQVIVPIPHRRFPRDCCQSSNFSFRSRGSWLQDFVLTCASPNQPTLDCPDSSIYLN